MRATSSAKSVRHGMWSSCEGCVAGSHPFAVGSTSRSIAGETGAIHQGPVESTSAGTVSRTQETVLGTAYVGARVLLCDSGRGGRGNDQSLHRESKVGRRRSGLQDNSAHGALSRLSAGHLPDGFSRTPATFSRRGFYRLSAGSLGFGLLSFSHWRSRQRTQ